ncbi:MAG: hypothetical protein JWM56_82 [Candidatus Peribacteria bacterium]|nr:hypothetical protein [Candidatus Peribacteria bacterium]
MNTHSSSAIIRTVSFLSAILYCLSGNTVWAADTNTVRVKDLETMIQSSIAQEEKNNDPANAESQKNNICTVQKIIGVDMPADPEAANRLWSIRYVAASMLNEKFGWEISTTVNSLEDASYCKDMPSVSTATGSVAMLGENTSLVPVLIAPDGYPTTGNAVFDACIRGKQVMRNDGTNRPMSCSRYHGDGSNRYVWTNPATPALSIWIRELGGDVLIKVPKGFEIVRMNVSTNVGQ